MPRKTQVKEQDLFTDAPIWWEGLTDNRKLFVELYCDNTSDCFLNATQAYIQAFKNENKKLSPASIKSNASRLRREPIVDEAIGKYLRAQQDSKDKISEYKVLDTLNLLSFYNPADIIDKDGKLKKTLDKLGPLAMCITGIEKTGKDRYKIKLFDRSKSIMMLANYLSIVRTPESNTMINPVVYLTDKEEQELHKEAAKSAPIAEDAEYEVMGAAV